MDRIVEIKIIVPTTSPIRISFRDEMDVAWDLSGRTYKPSWKALEILSKVAKKMEVEFDFINGITYLHKRGETND